MLIGIGVAKWECRGHVVPCELALYLKTLADDFKVIY